MASEAAVISINVWPEEIACLAKTLEKNELLIVGFVFLFIVLSRKNSKEHSSPCCVVTRICIPFASPMLLDQILEVKIEIYLLLESPITLNSKI